MAMREVDGEGLSETERIQNVHTHILCMCVYYMCVCIYIYAHILLHGAHKSKRPKP